MQTLRPPGDGMTEEEVARHERETNRVAWFGGTAVTLVTVAVFVFLAMSADSAWEYPVYALLGGTPLAYAAFSHLVIHRMQVSVLHRYEAQLLLQLGELTDMASRDGMTGLYNRRHFYEAVHHELGKAQVSRETLSLLVMDLDGLKGINDEYGHGVGDVIIANLGRVIAKHTRGSDVPARLGGDEFGILMPGTDKRGAFSLARRLWEELEQTPMYEQDAKYIMVTVSIGVSGFPWGGETLDELIQWADADMYANKVSRRLPSEPVPVQSLSELDGMGDDYLAGI
jgi:diguanylate cyclase (GGDEF)-like protein